MEIRKGACQKSEFCFCGTVYGSMDRSFHVLSIDIYCLFCGFTGDVIMENRKGACQKSEFCFCGKNI